MWDFSQEIFGGSFGLKEQPENSNIPKGAIAVASDFPLLGDVRNGWTYTAAANVIDNDATKTNTGQIFIAGQEFYWFDGAWVILGDDRLWSDDGTYLTPVNSRNIEVPSGKALKSDTVSELTSGAGVTVDGVKLLDGKIDSFGFNSIEKETADRTIYLSPTGSDTTGDGLTEETAFFSIHRALLSIKQSSVFTTYYGKLITILFAAGTYDYSALGNLDFSRFFEPGLSPRFNFKAVDGTPDNAFTIIESGTVTSNLEDGSVREDSTKAWAADTHKGKWFRINSMVSGEAHMPTASDRMGYIWGNDSTNLFTAFNTWVNYWDDVDTYDVCEPAVTLNFGANSIMFPSIYNGVYLYYLNIITTGGIFINSGSFKRTSMSNVDFNAAGCKIKAAEILLGVNVNLRTSVLEFTTNASQGVIGGNIYGCVFITNKSSSSVTPYRFADGTSLSSPTFIQTGATKFYVGSYASEIKVWGPVRLIGHVGLIHIGRGAASMKKGRIIIDRQSHYTHHQSKLYHSEYASPSNIVQTAAKSLIYLQTQTGLEVIMDKYADYIFEFLTEPEYGRITTTNTEGGELSQYHNEEDGVNALVLAPTAKSLLSFNQKENLDVDSAAPEVVDSFADTACKAVRWDFMISNSAGTAMRCGAINAGWDAAADDINDSGEYGVVNIGDTSDVTLSVDISSDLVRLMATAASDNWIVKVQRYPIG